MTGRARDPVLERLEVSQVDLATSDKLPVIRALVPDGPRGLALDVGVGTGFTTRSAFGMAPTVCVDFDARNLRALRAVVRESGTSPEPLCVVASAEALPLRDGTIARALCSEVLEHVHDDACAARELARVLRPDGALVVTVPYSGLGTVGFLGRLGIRTVHDFPGPECHVRPGYDERTLAELFAPADLRIERVAFFSRFFTRLATDAVSLAHLAYQRLVHRRQSWTWSDVAASRDGVAFRAYRAVFPAARAFGRLDLALERLRLRGFGIAVRLRKPAAKLAGEDVPR